MISILLCTVLACRQHAPNVQVNSNAASNLVKENKVPSAQLIVPGKNIGQTYFGEDMRIVFKKFGKPDVSDAAMGASLTSGLQSTIQPVTKPIFMLIIIMMANMMQLAT